MPAPLVFLDTETTGLSLSADIWEFAAIRREPDGTEDAIHMFIEHDQDKAAAMPDRFREDHDRRYNRFTAVSPAYAAGEIAAFTRPFAAGPAPHIVGAVPSFDTERLAILLRRVGIEPGWHYHLLDVEVMALGWLAGRDIQDGWEVTGWGAHLDLPMRSDDLSKACGVEPPTDADRHTAMGDAQWVMRWWDALTKDTALQARRR